MKKTTIFSSALVALAMLASCQKEQPIETPATTTGVTEFTATIEQPTKTAIASDGKIGWTAGDEITVTDAASKSAVYVAASSGSSTKFTPKDEKTTVGSGPYTATYGDITKQVYDENGANCPLTAAQTSTTNLHFSSPYAVVKLTAKSSGGESVKTVVVKYGNSSSILDCEEGVGVTSDGVVFYVAVRPSTEAAALSVSFYTADKMAKKTRKSNVVLAANDLLPVTFESLEWGGIPTFKAVYNTTNTTLTFYYDAEDHNGEGTVYEDGTANYLFDNTISTYQKWGYSNKASNIKSVVIDASVVGYPFLTSTAYMFQLPVATSISGAEYLDVSNVTNMSYMFNNFGNQSTVLNEVPDVSGWNTERVENMSQMFENYGKTSKKLAKVPEVKDWNTGNVTDWSSIFQNYGTNSEVLTTVPNVSNWKTNKVKEIDNMFNGYGSKSENIVCSLDLSGWDLSNLSDGVNAFEFRPKTFNVTIPAKTDVKVNEAQKWFYGVENHIQPARKPGSGEERHSFTLH